MGRWPLMVRGLVIAICGVLLGVGGCLGFLATVDSNDALAFLGGAGFFVGLFALAAGAIVFVIGAFKWFFGLMTARIEIAHGPHTSLPLLRRRHLDLLDVLPAHRRQDRL